MKPKRTRKVHVEIVLSVPATAGHLEVLRSAAESLTCDAGSISVSADPADPRITDTEFDILWARQEDVVDRIMKTMKMNVENFENSSVWFPKTEAEERRDRRHLERAKERRREKAAAAKAAYDAAASVSDNLSWLRDKQALAKAMSEYDAANKAFCDFLPQHTQQLIDSYRWKEAARKLGFPVRNDRVVFHSEQEMFFLNDFVIMTNTLHNRAPIDHLMEDAWWRGAMVPEIVRSMVAGRRYTLLFSREAVPGQGLICRDLITGQRLFLAEHGMSHMLSSTPSLLTAQVIMPVGRVWAGTGAPFIMRLNKQLDDAGADACAAELLASLGWKDRLPFVPTPNEQRAFAQSVLSMGIRSGIVAATSFA